MLLLTKKINGVEIAYDESGSADGPPIVLFTGWCHEISLYEPLLPYLAAKHWVIRVNWRGHGPSRDPIGDFGIEEQFNDTVALLEQLDVDKFYIISHSHGGWVALETADRLGKERVLGVLMLDQIMTAPPPEFATDLQGMQSKSTWRAARESLFDNWLANSGHRGVEDHCLYSLSSFGYDLWALSCRVIAGAYQAHDSPMGRMTKIKNPPPIRHIFSHPLNKDSYRQLHEGFAKEHAWFSWTDLQGATHFPSVEIPEKVAEQLEDLIKQTSS